MTRSQGCCRTAQDPEGILAAPKGGHIQRRTLQRQMVEDKELADKVEQAKQVARQELLDAREVLARSLPLTISTQQQGLPACSIRLETTAVLPQAKRSSCHKGK